MKIRSFYIRTGIFLFVCCLSIAATAQKSLPESRWTTGLEFGFPISIDCQYCNEESTISNSVGLNTSFRIVRWLGINFNSSFYRMDMTKHQWFGGFNFNSSDSFIKNDALNLSIGPQLLFRIGQGDLSVEARYGLVFNHTRMEGFNSETGSFKNNTREVIVGTSAFRVAYTYWPRHRFGIQFGVEAADNQYPEATVLLIDQTYDELYNTRLLSARGFSQINLLLGTYYRF